MESLFIEPTPNSPLIYFEPDGRLLIEGRAIPENVSTLFEPLLLYVDKLKAKHVNFDINLEYFNTAASKKILKMLKKIDTNPTIKSCIVNWHYETDDDDSLEMGEIFRDCLKNISFNIIEHSDIISLYDKFKPGEPK